MAVRSFQQILDSHEVAQAMLRFLEVDVRDTLNQARVELAKYPVAHVSSSVVSEEWEVGSRFILSLPPSLGDCITCNMSFDRVYTLAYNNNKDYPEYPLAFIDDKGFERVFYDFWDKLIRKV